MGATEGPGGEAFAAAQQLTPQQRATVIEYARRGSIEGAARELGLSHQTAKNHLSDAYRALGVKSGPQAVYRLMGGEDVIRTLPPPFLATRVRGKYARPHQRAVAYVMPRLVDGEITLRDLRTAARVGDFEASAGAHPVCRACGLSPLRATLSELVEWLRLYVRPRSPSSTG